MTASQERRGRCRRADPRRSSIPDATRCSRSAGVVGSASTSQNQPSRQPTWLSRSAPARCTTRCTGSASRNSLAMTTPDMGSWARPVPNAAPAASPESQPCLHRARPNLDQAGPRPPKRASARSEASARRPAMTLSRSAPRPAPYSRTIALPGSGRRSQAAARKRPRQRPKNGCSSGAVRKSPSRVGRRSLVA